MPAPVLIYTNQTHSDNYATVWNNMKSAIQNVLNLYNAMGLPALTPEEFPLLFSETQALLYDKITGGTLAIGGVPLVKAKAIDLVDKPTGYADFIEALQSFDAGSRNGQFDISNCPCRIDPNNITDWFALDVNGDLQFSARLQGNIDAAGKYYAVTDLGANVFQFLQDTIANYVNLGLNDVYAHHANPLPFLMSFVQKINSDGSFIVDYAPFTQDPFNGGMSR